MEQLLTKIWTDVGTPVTYFFWGYLGFSAFIVILVLAVFAYIFAQMRKQRRHINNRGRKY